MERLKRWELIGCIVAMAGLLLLLFSPLYGDHVSRTLFGIIFFLAVGSIVWGLVVGGKNRSTIAELERKGFVEKYERCSHCSGTGWVRKEG